MSPRQRPSRFGWILGVLLLLSSSGWVVAQEAQDHSDYREITADFTHRDDNKDDTCEFGDTDYDYVVDNINDSLRKQKATVKRNPRASKSATYGEIETRSIELAPERVQEIGESVGLIVPCCIKGDDACKRKNRCSPGTCLERDPSTNLAKLPIERIAKNRYCCGVPQRGQLGVAPSRAATGTVIGREAVLTAAHAVVDGRGQLLNRCLVLGWTRTAHAQGKETFEVRRLQSIIDVGTTYKDTNVGNNLEADDWIVARLDAPLDNCTHLTPSVATKPNTAVADIGYPAGMFEKYSDNARIVEFRDGLFSTTLDSHSGHSGSPILSAVDLERGKKGDSVELLGIVTRGGTAVTGCRPQPKECGRRGCCRPFSLPMYDAVTECEPPMACLAIPFCDDERDFSCLTRGVPTTRFRDALAKAGTCTTKDGNKTSTQD